MMEAVDAIPVARKQELLIIEQESALDSPAHIASGNFSASYSILAKS